MGIVFLSIQTGLNLMNAGHIAYFVAGIILALAVVNAEMAEIKNEAKTALNIVQKTGSFATMLVPAVNEKGVGLVTNLTVQVKPGEGRSLVDINNIFFWVDTQNSIRIAKQVAEEFTGADLSRYDIEYLIATNASAVEGPSAGAALAIATIAALEGKKLLPDVMITGTIRPDGSIGRVGEILSKAEAAKEFNATTLLIPEGQSISVSRGYEKQCKDYILYKTCASLWETKSTNLSEHTGINVVEVKNIKEALDYMVGE